MPGKEGETRKERKVGLEGKRKERKKRLEGYRENKEGETRL